MKATDFLTISNPKASGKMTTLQMLLDKFTSCGEKVLVFSYSTKVLDIIECLLKSKGWSFSRLVRIIFLLVASLYFIVIQYICYVPGWWREFKTATGIN